MPDSPKEYAIRVNTDDIHEAIRSIANALYALTQEALTDQNGNSTSDSDFEIFARDMLGVLVRHGDMLSEDEVSWEEDENDYASENRPFAIGCERSALAV